MNSVWVYVSVCLFVCAQFPQLACWTGLHLGKDWKNEGFFVVWTSRTEERRQRAVECTGRCNGTSKAMDGGFIVTVQKLYQGLVLNLRYTHLPP